MSFKFIRSTSGIKSPCPEGAVITVGNFDGIHKGHAAMIKQAVSLAHVHKLASVVMTFSPHPREVFNPEKRHHRLMRVDDKARRVRSLGADILYVQKFSKSFASLSAQQFLDDILIGKLNAKHILVGEDFAFGKGRCGTAQSLKEMAENKGIQVHILQDVTAENERISSTQIRALLEQGDVEKAADLMGSPWCIRTGLYEDDNLVLRGDISRYLPIKNAVYWVKIAYTYLAEQKEATLPLAVNGNVVKIHPVGQIPDIPEGRVLLSFLKKEKDLNV